MTRLAILCLAAAPALADDFTQTPRMTLHADPPPGAARFARAQITHCATFPLRIIAQCAIS